MGKHGKGGSGTTRMTSDAASRIQRAHAKATGGKTPKGSFPARAQAAAARNAARGTQTAKN